MDRKRCNIRDSYTGADATVMIPTKTCIVCRSAYVNRISFISRRIIRCAKIVALVPYINISAIVKVEQIPHLTAIVNPHYRVVITIGIEIFVCQLHWRCCEYCCCVGTYKSTRYAVIIPCSKAIKL